MAIVEVKVPQLSESVAEATLLAWHKREGERVQRDENLIDVETDKVVLEVPSPVTGVLQEIRAKPGTVVKRGELHAVIAEGGVEPGVFLARIDPAKVATARKTSTFFSFVVWR